MTEPYWNVTIVYTFDNIDPIAWTFDFRFKRGGGLYEMMTTLFEAFLESAKGVQRAVEDMVGTYKSRTITFEAIGPTSRHRMSVEVPDDISSDEADVTARQFLSAITSGPILEMFKEHCLGT